MNIIDEPIEQIKKEVTSFNDDFKFLNFTIDKVNREKLAKFLFDDKINQGRLKKVIRNEFLSLFTENIGDEIGDVSYIEGPAPGQFGELKKVKRNALYIVANPMLVFKILLFQILKIIRT